MKHSKIALILTIIMFSALCALSQTMQNGVLDICGSKAVSNEIIKIKGECQFYWNKLLTPADIESDSAINPILVTIPKVWTKYSIDGKKLPAKGYATYKFTIKKDADKQPTIYGLNISTVFSNYKIWVNGKLISEVGRVDSNESTSTPAFLYQNIPFILDPSSENTSQVDVVMQVSNFSHRRAGLHTQMYFGLYENLIDDTRWMDILNLIIIGIILLIGVNHICLYLLRPSDISNLFFGLVCLIMMLRNLSTGDRIISYMFPGIGWELLFKLDNISGFATIGIFALFFYELFKQEFPKWVYKLLLYIGIAIMILVIFTPAYFYGQFRTFYEIYVLCGGLFLTFGVLLRASIKKRPYAIYPFIGMLLLYGTTFFDVAGSMGLAQATNLAPYGLVAFMIIQSITINMKSAHAINNNEILGYQLQAEKENLEQKVEERISDLKLQQAKLLQHQEREKIENWRNNGISKLNDVIVHHKDSYRNLCYYSLVELVKYVDAKLGVIYLADTENSEGTVLSIIASYGLSKDIQEANAKIPTDSGLVGASYTRNIMQHITEVPDSYFKISSGMGSSKPNSLLIIPLNFDGKVLGVLEIASFETFNEITINFVKKIVDILSGNINTSMMNEQNIRLIQQFDAKTAEMKENEEHMRQTIEDLEIIREQYERLKEEVERKS